MRQFLFENLIDSETGLPVIVSYEAMPPRDNPDNAEDQKILEIFKIKTDRLNQLVSKHKEIEMYRKYILNCPVQHVEAAMKRKNDLMFNQEKPYFS